MHRFRRYRAKVKCQKGNSPNRKLRRLIIDKVRRKKINKKAKK